MIKKISVFAKAFLFIFLDSGIAGFVLYFGLRTLLHQSPIVFTYPRGIPYYDQHPAPFLISLSIIFALISSFGMVLIAPRIKSSWSRWVLMGIIPFVTVIIAGLVWGIIAIYYDMKVGFFPPLPSMLNYIWWGAQQGMLIGPISAWVSFPINLISYVIAYLLLFALTRISTIQIQNKK